MQGLNPKSEIRNPKAVIPSLTSGLIVGILEVALAISFAALIFSGSLSPFVSYGIGYALVGAIIGGTIIALFTSWPGFVGGNQDAPAAILALIAAAITGLMPASATAEETFFTVLVTIALSTLVTGLFLLGMGYFHLGDLARFLPYPVVGGFLAGTGWLLITGAVGLMADVPADIFQLPGLMQGEVLIRWLPGVILAIVIIFVSNRVDNYLVLPFLLFLFTILFFFIALVSGVSFADLSADGWLLGPFAGDGLWQPITPAMISAVYWPAVVSQASGIATIVLISSVGLLLNAGGVELAVDRDIDFDKELRVAGIANTMASVLAGMTGFHQLSFSILNYKIGANNRLTGLVGVAVCVLALLAGASLLAIFPKIIIGALLFLLGLSLLIDWVIEGWSKLPLIDFIIVIAILLVTAFVGFLEAVGLGLLLAVILFVVGYSQVDVVRHELSGATFQSREIRSRYEENLLREHGDEIYILQLRGFVFFGTAESFLKRLRKRMYHDHLPQLTAVVFDLEYVSGLDSTAMLSFNKIETAAQKGAFVLVMCGPNKRVREQLEKGGLIEDGEIVFYFNSADRGTAWCEERLLAEFAAAEALNGRIAETPEGLLILHLVKIFLATQEHYLSEEALYTAVTTMLSYCEKVDIAEGEVFIYQGEPADTLYFLAEGKVTAHLARRDGSFIRLETTRGAGHMLGEIGFFLGGERTADVQAETPAVLYRLRRDDLARMQEETPQAAALLNRLVAHILAERVSRLTKTVKALER